MLEYMTLTYFLQEPLGGNGCAALIVSQSSLHPWDFLLPDEKESVGLLLTTDAAGKRVGNRRVYAAY